MKFLHISDLHIGKRVNEFSMIEDQEYILDEILKIVDQHKPQVVLIAGDIYDKGIPSIEGVVLFDRFLTRLHRKETTICMVSGNHDSSERIGFGGRIMRENNIYIAGTYEGKLEKVSMEDEYGIIHIYLMPFIKPAMARRYFPEIESYQDAVEAILANEEIDRNQRNILVAHQFIISGETVPEQCESETISIGGLDSIDASVFQDFDYVALGHLHGAQKIGRDTIRYAGSPLKYSFSETRQKKSVTLVEIGDSSNIAISLIPLVPKRDMRIIKGPISALTDPAVYSKANTEDYIQAILTDEEEIYDAIGKLRSIYPNIMRLEFENGTTGWNAISSRAAADIEKKSSIELFEEFFQNQNHKPMNEKQKSIMYQMFEEMVGE
ncbi:MAG TPA: exonuclease SbcCD subunit D [Clostridiales bacterium]|nr:exonuclease SbcCD subunit D [Clostridiales bacterium]